MPRNIIDPTFPVLGLICGVVMIFAGAKTSTTSLLASGATIVSLSALSLTLCIAYDRKQRLEESTSLISTECTSLFSQPSLEALATQNPVSPAAISINM